MVHSGLFSGFQYGMEILQMEHICLALGMTKAVIKGDLAFPSVFSFKKKNNPYLLKMLYFISFKNFHFLTN